MRVLPEVFMVLLTSAIVTGQCLRPAAEVQSPTASNTGEAREAELTLAEKPVLAPEPAMRFAMATTPHFDDPCPGELPDNEAMFESSAKPSPVAITLFGLPEKI